MRSRREWNRREARAGLALATWTKPRRGELAGANESIEVRVRTNSQSVSGAVNHTKRSRRESSESGDREMDFSPKGERAGASESIEGRIRGRGKESQALMIVEAAFPAGI